MRADTRAEEAWARERRALAAVARGDAPADRYVHGGLVLNVYTGELYPAHVAIRGERVAYVGPRDDMVGPRTGVIDARGRTLVPGYIEPHAHPWNLVTPAALARHVLPLGTTAVVGDNLSCYQLCRAPGFARAMAALSRLPLRYYWMVRIEAQAQVPGEATMFPLPALRRLLDAPEVVAVGETTRWPRVEAGEMSLLRRAALAALRGKRHEGHTAGAKPERLAAIAAAGVTSDHEPITADEARERMRQGIAVMLRQSSLRPDLAELVEPFAKSGSLGRLMLTTDGSTPAFIAEHGFVDNLLRVAMRQGIPPIEAYRMATLNPATYFGRDADLGGIAPGRYADINLLHDLEEPRPAAVIARGRLVAEGGALRVAVPEPDWARIFTPAATRFTRRWRLAPEDLALPSGPIPVIRLVSAVITTAEVRPMRGDDLHLALVDRRGGWIATTAIAGLATDLDGLAATLSTDCEIVAAGRSRAAVARAVNRLLDRKGGVVVVDGDRIAFDLPLPVGGLMSRRPLPEVARAERELRALLVARGYPWHDPLFTLLFLTADFLPSVRMSSRGVWDVKRARVLRPSQPLAAGPR
jgi:adenine deaminase